MTEHIEASVALYLAFTQEPYIGSRVCIRASAYQFVGQKVTPSVLFGKLGNCTHRPLRPKYNREARSACDFGDTLNPRKRLHLLAAASGTSRSMNLDFSESLPVSSQLAFFPDTIR